MLQLNEYKNTRLNGIEELEKDYKEATGIDKVSSDYRLVVRIFFREVARQLLEGEEIDLGPFKLSILVSERGFKKNKINWNETKKLKEKLIEKHAGTKLPREITYEEIDGKKVKFSNGGFKYAVYYIDDTYLFLKAKFKDYAMRREIYRPAKATKKFWAKVDRKTALKYKVEHRDIRTK